MLIRLLLVLSFTSIAICADKTPQQQANTTVPTAQNQKSSDNKTNTANTCPITPKKLGVYEHFLIAHKGQRHN